MTIIAKVRENGNDIPVEVMDLMEGSGGRKLAIVHAIHGQPFTQCTHGGPSNSSTAYVPVAFLKDIQREPDPSPTPTVAGNATTEQEKKNLLQLALEHEKPQWQTTEKIYLVPGKVYLSNDTDYVNLHIIGYRPYLTIFMLYPSEGWKRCRDLESKYQKWVADYQKATGAK